MPLWGLLRSRVQLYEDAGYTTFAPFFYQYIVEENRLHFLCNAGLPPCLDKSRVLLPKTQVIDHISREVFKFYKNKCGKQHLRS
jgi:hypothetical protein